jgi:hypothetical protein
LSIIFFVGFGIEFVGFGIEFVGFGIEFVGFGIEFVGFRGPHRSKDRARGTQEHTEHLEHRGRPCG